MGIWLNAWDGDNAGPVIGRERNRLLFSLTHSDGTFPPGIFQHGKLGNVDWYVNLSVTCLTPGARDAISVAVERVGDYVWSVEVAEVDWGQGKAPWQAGTHLFSAMLLAPFGHQSGTIGTVIVDDGVKRFGLRDFETSTNDGRDRGEEARLRFARLHGLEP